ncbi:sulfite exporter TauE/SafE family protein [Parasulfitobacter algicola]|uniref:Probable membrane transporter protein n=1 Tax=Parasulfitobacter algicola TaxID=2614809 RepID=A0ABX2IVQ7_9RHOB|nr:sulfite exporter TauE/SafE family protein [Sulfitobacter algicola]NSX56375.1 sulfite exporter TauE/SafE family protein [Sulfitobacter algicola]
MPELSTLLPLVAILLVFGAVAGVLAGLLGVGGGIVLVPGFFYVFTALGYDSPYLMQICLATSLATIIVTSGRSVMSHHKKGAVEWPILKTWAIGIGIGAVIGVLVAAQLRSTVLQAIFGCMGVIIGFYMAFGRSEWRLGAEMPTGIARAIYSTIVGFLSVLMGIGGGSLGVPLMSLYGRPIHNAVATAAGFGALIAIPSVIGFLLIPIPAEVRPPFTIGAVNFPTFGVIIAMTLLTAPIGAKIAHKMNPKPLKRVFAVFLILVAANMLRKAVGW